MQLKKLSLINFKNYSNASLEFCGKFNCFVGNNGQGKTNLLDAIHYLAFCKSFFNPIDSQNILFDSPFFVVQGEFEKDGHIENIYCGLKRNEKKQFKKNQKDYSRLADHIGFIPLVMVSPSDGDLITEGSDIRRKFIDNVISQYDKQYLEKLIQYNKVLAQRNALLKSFFEGRFFDADSLEIWDMQLVPLGEELHKKRKKFIVDFSPHFQKYYSHISDNKEPIMLEYESQLNEGRPFEEILKESLPKDRSALYTTCGIHKDDLAFTINGYPVKKMASQGQQKTFLLALKLAKFAFLKKVKKIQPILLLDDILDKLDESRVSRLMEIVGSDDFGQIFITDTHPERILNILAGINVLHKSFQIEKGMVL
ncbi:MAG: DNA replication and repair protein RecF [Bacteroidetes bacterium]|nr:DNA replication and repair protein RecF [Bacteroidota bacterium]